MICSSFRVAMQLATATCSWPQHFAGYFFLPACTPSWGVPRRCAPTVSSCPLKCRPAYHRVSCHEMLGSSQTACVAFRAFGFFPPGFPFASWSMPALSGSRHWQSGRHGRCLIFFTASTMAGGCCLLLPQIKKEKKENVTVVGLGQVEFC